MQNRREKNGDTKDSFYKELEEAFNHFPKYHVNIPVGDFNTKSRREDILKPTIGNESLHQDSNDNGLLPHQKF
jgi:exonuclease III